MQRRAVVQRRAEVQRRAIKELLAIPSRMDDDDGGGGGDGGEVQRQGPQPRVMTSGFHVAVVSCMSAKSRPE